MPLIPVFLIIAAFFTLLFFFLAFKVYQRSVLYLPKRKELPAPGANFQFVSHRELNNWKDHPDIESRIAQDFLKANLASIYLVHGTFVGEDPFHVASLLERSFPNLKPSVIAGIKTQIKKGQDLLAKDVGNFVSDHVHYLEQLFQKKVAVHNFGWSSGNHHHARVEGMLDLIDHIIHRHEKDARILLIGHSHAGSMFAVLGQLFFDNAFRDTVHKIFPERRVKEKLIAVQQMYFDIVTYGTPVRYEWILAENMRVLHFINHRGEDLYGGSFKDATFTKKGDYIQQWGIAGSDMKSSDHLIQQANELLSQHLGAGSDLELLRETIQLKKRLHNQGFHYLVDYGDQGRFPNFFKTVFGHGVYTKLPLFKFHLQLIREKFYL